MENLLFHIDFRQPEFEEWINEFNPIRSDVDDFFADEGGFNTIYVTGSSEPILLQCFGGA
jgi:hypothetical protein